jgi:hypothetical protein
MMRDLTMSHASNDIVSRESELILMRTMHCEMMCSTL